MVTLQQVRGLVDRLGKAEAIVREGRVQQVAGSDSYIVRNGEGWVYLVWPDQSCSCPDFEHRAKNLGFPCKHLLAVAIYREKAAEQQNGGPKASGRTTAGNGAAAQVTHRPATSRFSKAARSSSPQADSLPPDFDPFARL